MLVPMTLEILLGETRARCGKSVVTDEPTVIAKPSLKTIVTVDGQYNGRLPDPPDADESNGFRVFSETKRRFRSSHRVRNSGGGGDCLCILQILDMEFIGGSKSEPCLSLGNSEFIDY